MARYNPPRAAVIHPVALFVSDAGTRAGSPYFAAMQNRWRSPRMSSRLATGTGVAMMRSPIGFSPSNSNFSPTLAASVTVSVRRVWVRLSSAFPLQALYERCARRLGCMALGAT